MRRMMFFVVVMLSAVCQAQDTGKKEIGVSFDVTYLSKWLSKGFESYGQQGALFETVDLDLWGTGFGTAVTHRSATSSGYVDKERFDYQVYYGNSFFGDCPYLTKYEIRWAYKHYPRQARNRANTTNEWRYSFSWPRILPVKSLVPYYIVYYEYPAGSNYEHHDVTGWVHVFGLGYDVSTPGFLPDTNEQVFHLSADMSYNDGLGGRAVDHDWSHATFGVSTKFKMAENLSFVPGVYLQKTMDRSVSRRDDIAYTVLSMKYVF